MSFTDDINTKLNILLLTYLLLKIHFIHYFQKHPTHITNYTIDPPYGLDKLR